MANLQEACDYLDQEIAEYSAARSMPAIETAILAMLTGLETAFRTYLEGNDCLPIDIQEAVELMQQVLLQSISVFARPSLPEGNGIFLVPGGTSGATKTAPLDQHPEGVHHLLLGSAQIEEGRASVPREGLPASLALEKLRALLAVTPVADDIPFP